MKTTLKLHSLALISISAVIPLAQATTWPVIRPLQEKKVFTKPGQNNTDTPFLAFIKDNRGASVYKLECHNGNYENESAITFSGDFQCALFGLKGTTLTSGNLLAADTPNELSTDWWNRGRMRSAQLRGECLKYPEYSVDRHFQLRGMLLNLRFTEVQWRQHENREDPPRLARFTFIFKVIPDNSARGSRPAIVPGPAPPEACYP